MAAKKTTRRTFLKTSGLTAAAAVSSRAAGAKKKNVLFIAVDDLRPQLGCYGKKQMISPNIDRLAARGVLFERAYCQVPVCGASRASLLTGLRPTRNRFLSYKTLAEKDARGVVTLPRHFKRNGYHTVSNGKVFHHKTDCKGGWSEEIYRPKDFCIYHTEENRALVKNTKRARGLPWECAAVGDSDYQGGKIADKVIADLRKAKKEGYPFFITAGFTKPHLPFNCPQKYWDRYDREKIVRADNPFPPKNAPRQALHNFGELRSYAKVPKKGPVPAEMAITLKHGYYACVTYTDTMIGKILEELDRLDMDGDTVVILWGDHGWQLEEHGLWCKHCNFNTSLNAPLIVAAPGVAHNQKARGLVEFLDIYPTLCDLAGLEKPAHLQGRSLAPLMQNPGMKWNEAIFSRWHSGESVRTDRFLYTEWRDKKGAVSARMLYDHKKDPDENVNVAEEAAYADDVKRLHTILSAHLAKRI